MRGAVRRYEVANVSKLCITVGASMVQVLGTVGLWA